MSDMLPPVGTGLSSVNKTSDNGVENIIVISFKYPSDDVCETNID